MRLDVPTLTTMESFVLACAGAVLFLAWSQNRKLSALALWSLSYFATAAGVFALIFGASTDHGLWSMAGSSMLAAADGLTWKAARTFDAKPAPLAVALLGAGLVVGCETIFPQIREVSGTLNLAAGAVYLVAGAVSLWNGRKEWLAARLPLVLFMVLHGAVVSIGAWSRLIGAIGQREIPPVMSLFGFIHFESTIYALGGAVFILALVKERKEAASSAAASIDPLTGVANRAAFQRRAERAMQRCRRQGTPVSVVMFDLDWFKSINDAHGHAVGDAVLQRFCAVASAALWPSDVFGRIGGEEFAIVMPGSSIEAAGSRADRIRASFASDCRFIGDRQVNATLSGGVSTSANGKEGLTALLERADAALYRAKADGRNCIRRADLPELDAGSSNVLRVA
jgi:diguanylate cyclase (GGDEF)-like protein